MTLTHIQIHQLRQFSSFNTTFHPHINFITGKNGIGKTSLLEAIYLLSRGHSFRTREIVSLVSHGQDKLTVYAKTIDQSTISISKSLSKSTMVKLNSTLCYSNSELAYFLPTQVLYQDIFQIIDAGPGARRSILDWGLFHVKQQYLLLCKDYKRALKQRNVLLKQRAPVPQLVPWNALLSLLAEQFDVLRNAYINDLNRLFKKVLATLSDIPCDIIYYKGWDKKEEGKSLENTLIEHYQSDLHRQYTQYGPHQADLYFQSQAIHAKHFLSRGQQKIILFALKFAQAQLLEKPCLFLIDDLSAELDDHHVGLILNYIAKAKGQFFITSHTPIAKPGVLAESLFSSINIEEALSRA